MPPSRSVPRPGSRRLHPLLAPVLVLLLGGASPAAAPPEPAAGSRGALRRGNHLYRQGDLEGAADAYRAASDEGDPLLAYNLATTLHHLGNLPEAVLWYRRAKAGLGPDRWLEENLARARADLASSGARRLGPPRLLTPVLRHSWLLPALAAACAWAGLLAALASSAGRSPRARWRRRGAVALLACGLALWAAELALARLGPRPAVLLGACGELPAGSEAWVTPEGAGGFRIVGADETCEREAVGLVRSPGPTGRRGFW